MLRNAGATVTDDVIRSLAVSQRRLGTTDVMLISHTGCGMQTLDEDEFAAELEQAAGVAPAVRYRVRRRPRLPRAPVDRPGP